MNTMVWIILCLFASLGIVQAVGLLIRWGRKPRGTRAGYYIIPLYEGPENTEAQLRHSISRMQWGGHSGEIAMILDMGADEESLAICEEMMSRYGLLYCKESQFIETVRKLDALQDRMDHEEKG